MPRFSSLRFAPFLVFGLFLAALLFAKESQFRFFDPSDPDDFMRLVQVRDFLQGQNWFDVSQHRLAPALASDLHWSRLADLPLAGLTLLLSPFLEMEAGLRASALFLPILMLGLLLLPLCTAIARAFVSRERSEMAGVFLFVSTPALLFNFTPSRVDHHAFSLLITALALYALPRLAMGLGGKRLAALTGLAFGLGLWIGMEILPSLLLFGGLLAASVLWRGKGFAAARWFGFSLFTTSLVALALARPSPLWFVEDVTWFSITSVSLALCIALTLAALQPLCRFVATRRFRFAGAAGVGAAALGLFFFLTPRLILEGPYGNLDAGSAPLILDHVIEAKPLAHLLASADGPITALGAFARYLLIPLLAVGAGLFFLLKSPSPRRRMTGFLFLAYTMPLWGLALFYQVRLLAFAQITLLPVIVFAFWKSFDCIAAKLRGRPRFWAEIALFGFLGPVSTMLIPVLLSGAPLTPAKLLFPALHGEKSCSQKIMGPYLNDPAEGGRIRHTILNAMNNGPELLYRTPHAITSAPYGTRGNEASLAFFTATSDQTALAEINKTKADLVLVCRDTPAYYAGITPETALKAELSQDSSGALVLRNRNKTLFERLVDNQPPAWLKRVEVPFEPNLLLFAVQP